MMTNYQNHYFCLPNLDFMKIAKGSIRFSRKDKQNFFQLSTNVSTLISKTTISQNRKLEASSEDSYFNNAFCHTICFTSIARPQSMGQTWTLCTPWFWYGGHRDECYA
ncbi:MAG: hypothetical protein CM15mP59_2860 [Flavobacteriaceae bacterium]|nr:MAG: hypothetical protein CM15mP59_2860 [Flavobacteriaceae bacterium]